MCEGNRRIIVGRHTFFVDQAKQRLLNQCSNIEAEADRYEQEAWAAAQAVPCYDGEIDQGDLAEAVRDEAVGHYMLLDGMKKQTLLSVTAGMFHQWDKELREFLDMELRHYIKFELIEGLVWKPTTSQIFETLKEFGWDVRQEGFFNALDACNLVVNVYKHGKGNSLSRLHDAYPRYLSREGWESWTGKIYVDHHWLSVNDVDFDEFAGSIAAFWQAMPQRCYYDFPDT